MKKFDLLRSGDNIIRVLEIQGDRVLVIDCIRRTMPVWVDVVILESYMGSEYTSETFEQIAELGVTVFNLPSYRPELKGLIEKFFDLVQESYKKYLKGKGVIEPDYQERGAHDYRKDACLTMRDFEKIILHCIIYYNSQRIVESFPYTEAMVAAHVKPYASQIWNWEKGTDANIAAEDYRTIQPNGVEGQQAAVSL